MGGIKVSELPEARSLTGDEVILGVQELDSVKIPTKELVIKTELAASGGAAMIGQGVMAVNTIADLLALPTGQRKADMRYLVKEYHAGTGVGGGEFYWDSVSVESDNGGTVFAVSGVVAGRYFRLWDGSKTPEMFGAIPGSSSNNKAAISALFASTGKIEIPAGKTYMLGHGEILAYSNTHIHGSGALIRESGSSGHLIRITNQSNILIEDVTLDVNDQRVPYNVGTVGQSQCIYIEGGSENIVIRNNTLLNASRDGIYIRQAGMHPRNIKVCSNTIKGSTRTGVSIVGGEKIDVFNNTIVDFGLSGINSEAHTPSTISREMRFKGNIVIPGPAATSGSIMVQNPQGFDYDNFRDFEVEDNIVYSVNGNDTIVFLSVGENIRRNAIARNNVVFNSAQAIGPFDIIEGNIIATAGNPETSGTIGAIRARPGSIVRNNIIYEAYSSGIYCPSGGVLVENNFIRNCGKYQNETSLEGIAIYSRQSSNIIKNNTIEDKQITPTTRRGIFVRDAGGNVIINNNIIGSFLDAKVVQQFGQENSYYSIYDKKTITLASEPTLGVWEVGDIINNSTPTPGGFLGWVCTSPGDFITDVPVFKGFGQIEA